ncbi:uncharacterized protein SCHCODRAFT_02503248 [Schizophyllum commune H4-8]|nr:uncharacterized protein SCHCODRAFT_02503248 [Schizophyllum commune H4-8]KAI5892304.1 hypothetical protein SCHCODRAFT_02503248 [Schizophyllum commune H4-8]
MQLTTGFAVCLSLFSGVFASLTTGVQANIVSEAELMHWLKTTDAELTFVGEPIPGINAPEGLAARAAETTKVIYCSTRSLNVCGGRCTVYNGGPACLNAPNTNCLSATHNVAFCGAKGCNYPCTEYAHCESPMDDGFCFTPYTNAILVGNY